MDGNGSISTKDSVEEIDTNLQLALKKMVFFMAAFLRDMRSSLLTETDNFKILENIKTCVGYMPTYSISEVDQKLLILVMPTLKRILQRAFDDNFLLSDTCDDEFVVNILKQNLRLILHLIHVLKEVLEFIVEQSEITLCDVKSVAVTSIQVILSTFDHCRKSSETYKKNFNEELSEVFTVMQDAHFLYLQLFESRIIVADILEDDVEVLLEVLDHLCTVSETLFFLNLKLLTTNWRGYLGIAQKFFEVLKNHLDLRRPIKYLTSIIFDSFSSIKDTDSTTQVIKLCGFLVKVVFKICDIFEDDMQKGINEILEFFCMIYSFTPHKFLMMEYPTEIAKLVDDTIFAYMKSFVLKFCQYYDISSQAIPKETILSEKYCFGFLNFLNVCIEGTALIDENRKPQLETLVNLVFECVRMCFEEFFWPENVFDDLVINISAAVMTHDKLYALIEIILLENVLQEEIWNYFLATEIWCLLLRNSNPHFCASTLTNLVKIYDQLNFGVNTHRLESVYLVSFIQRVFRMLPDYMKDQMGQSVQTHAKVWKKSGFRNFPSQMKNIVEDVQLKTLEKIEELGTDSFTCKDLVLLVDNLESLSTVNYQDMDISPTNLVNAIENIWELQFNDTANNLFRYFIVVVCKITSNFTEEFNNKQLYMILSQLTHLSSDDFFKPHVCFMLESFCYLNTNQLGQDGIKMFKTISNILSNLLNSNNIVKQNVLELLEALTQNGKYDVVRDVLANCSNNTRGFVSDYLGKRCGKSEFNADYFKAVGRLKYKHTCVKWRNVPSANGHKRIKLDTFEKSEADTINFQQISSRRECDAILSTDTEKIARFPQQDPSVREEKTVSTISPAISKFKYGYQQKKDKPVGVVGESKEHEDDVTEVLARIKGEVKCLMDVLKTEKLTPKNVSDLKILTSQLLSLM